MGCTKHLDAPEAFACTGCPTRWCVACVVAGPSGRPSCPACGRLVEKATPALTSAQLLTDAVQRACSVDGAITAAAFAAVYAASAIFDILFVVYAGVLVGFYFATIHHVGDARAGLPGPADVSEGPGEVFGFALRGLVCTALGLAPWLAFYAATGELPSGLTTLGLLALGQIYMPAAILGVAFSSSAIAAIWPVIWIRVIARAPADYARFVVVWIGSLVVGWLVFVASAPLVLLGAAGMFGAAFAWNLFWIAHAVLVGNYLRKNAAAFGW